MAKEKLSRKAFNALPEYSLSLPTGQTTGKVWKMNRNWLGGPGHEDWLICEYVEHPDSNLVGIEYRIPVIED